MKEELPNNTIWDFYKSRIGIIVTIVQLVSISAGILAYLLDSKKAVIIAFFLVTAFTIWYICWSIFRTRIKMTTLGVSGESQFAFLYSNHLRRIAKFGLFSIPIGCIFFVALTVGINIFPKTEREIDFKTRFQV